MALSKDAEKYLTAKLRELDLGAFVEPTRKTVGECFDQWLRNVRHSITTRTADGYQGWFERNLRPRIGGTRLTSLRTDDIQSIYTEMIERGLSARSVRHTHVVLNALLEDALAKGLIARNPAALVNLPRVEYVERRVLSEEEAIRFLHACNERPDGLIFEFAVMTGMRPQEFLAVKWSDIDFDRHTVMILRALERHKGQ
ncbi:MAG: tyrosine-type recombinase/integrase [Blastocatellia bacterium]